MSCGSGGSTSSRNPRPTLRRSPPSRSRATCDRGATASKWTRRDTASGCSTSTRTRCWSRGPWVATSASGWGSRGYRPPPPSEGPAQGPDGRRITADPTYAGYMDLQIAASGLARDREAIAQMLVHAPDSGIAVDQLAMIGAVQRSSELIAALKELTDRQAELRALRFRYADTHPPVRRLAAQVDTLARRVIPGLGRALIAGLAARERELRQRADSITGELRRAPPAALEEVRLARDQA